MRIVYVCNRKARCNDSVYCGKECTHTFNERNARYSEHGKYLILGDGGQGFVLEEIENDQPVNQHGE